MTYSVRILGIPVGLGLSLPLFLFLLGVGARYTPAHLIIWVAFGWLAILLHELGHALAFRHYGLESTIRFWLIGGLTVPTDQDAAAELADRRWVVVAFAGPAVGLVLGGASLVAWPFAATLPDDVEFAVRLWTFVNLGWGIFNLLPIGALDGGQVLSHLMLAALAGRGRALAFAVSILVSALIAVLAFENGFAFVGVIAVLFGVVNPAQYAGFIDALLPGRQERKRREQADRESDEETPERGSGAPSDQDRTSR